MHISSFFDISLFDVILHIFATLCNKPSSGSICTNIVTVMSTILPPAADNPVNILMVSFQNLWSPQEDMIKFLVITVNYLALNINYMAHAKD